MDANLTAGALGALLEQLVMGDAPPPPGALACAEAGLPFLALRVDPYDQRAEVVALVPPTEAELNARPDADRVIMKLVKRTAIGPTSHHALFAELVQLQATPTPERTSSTSMLDVFTRDVYALRHSRGTMWLGDDTPGTPARDAMPGFSQSSRLRHVTKTASIFVHLACLQHDHTSTRHDARGSHRRSARHGNAGRGGAGCCRAAARR